MNLNPFLVCSKIATYVSACFMFIAVGLAIGNGSAVIEHADISLTKLDSVSDNMNRTLDEINRPCSGKAPCGTLSDVNKSLETLRGTMGQFEVAARHENKQLSTLDEQEQVLYADLHSTLVVGQGALNESAQLMKTTNATVAKIQPVLNETQKAVAGVTVAVGNVNVLVTDPNLAKTMQNVQESTKATTITMQSVQKTSGEVQIAVHGYLHPSWARSTANWTLKVVRAVNPF